MNSGDVASVLGLPVSLVEKLTLAGKLPGKIINGCYTYSRRDIKPFIPTFYSQVIRNRVVSDKIFFCPRCRKSWDVMYDKNGFKTTYYEDFPTLGHSRVICQDCEQLAKTKER